VSYDVFLDRFQIRLSPDYSHWKSGVVGPSLAPQSVLADAVCRRVPVSRQVRTLYDSLLAEDLEMDELLQYFDQNGDGKAQPP